MLQLVVNGLVTGSVYAIAAAGVSIVYGILRFVHFAYGDVIAFGAFVAVWFNVQRGLGVVEATALAMAATALLSIGLELALWRPLRARGAGFMSMFLAAIGLALVLRQLLFLVAGPQTRAYDIDPYKVYELGSVRLSLGQAAAVVASVAAIVLVGLLIGTTSVGRRMRAMADDRALAAVAGVNTTRVVLFTWVLAGALAALAGVLSGLVAYSFDPNFGFALLLPVFAAVVLGGIGSVYGALLGGLVLGIATELATWEELAGGVDPVYKPVVAFGLLIVALLIRPQGLFGRARVV